MIAGPQDVVTTGDASVTTYVPDSKDSVPSISDRPDVRSVPPGAPSKRRHVWTREAVIAELGGWLLGGRVVEAAFLKRHGPPGLVAAAKKLFGRFDAALNAANLAVADQVQTKRRAEREAAREHLPTLGELARRQQRRRSAHAAQTP